MLGTAATMVAVDGLERDPLFTALTRPQMFAGVTYGWFVVNGVVATELFLPFRSTRVLALALVCTLSARCCACASRASSNCG